MMPLFLPAELLHGNEVGYELNLNQHSATTQPDVKFPTALAANLLFPKGSASHVST